MKGKARINQNELQREAMELRYEGATYDAIATTLSEKYPEDPPLPMNTVKTWFTVGALNQLYPEYERKMNERRAEEAIKIFVKGVTVAQRTLIEVMEQGKVDVARVMAAKEWLERGMGKVAIGVKGNIGVGVVVGTVADFTKAIYERRAQRAATERVIAAVIDDDSGDDAGADADAGGNETGTDAGGVAQGSDQVLP